MIPVRGLVLRRASERRAWLSGPAALINAIARSSGLVSRSSGWDVLRVIEHEDEAVLVAACAAAGCDVRPTCALCEASACSVHDAISPVPVPEGAFTAADGPLFGRRA